MKILLANHHLRHLGGSETFTYAIYKELKGRGHEVKVLSFEWGAVSNRMDQEDLIDISKIREGYDLAIVMHNTCLRVVSGIVKKVICIVNSTFEGVEQPVKGADEYIAVSEEVREHLKKKGFKSRVVRNGVDLERFRPELGNKSLAYPKELKVVLQISNKPETKAIVKEACVKLGLDYITVGLPQLSVWNVERMIWAADLVVSIGRGVYEAMACGRPAIVFDIHGYDGVVMPVAASFRQFLYFNSSGRATRIQGTVDYFVGGIEAVREVYFNQDDCHNLTILRRMAEQYFDIKRVVDELLKE